MNVINNRINLSEWLLSPSETSVHIDMTNWILLYYSSFDNIFHSITCLWFTDGIIVVFSFCGYYLMLIYRYVPREEISICEHIIVHVYVFINLSRDMYGGRKEQRTLNCQILKKEKENCNKFVMLSHEWQCFLSFVCVYWIGL